jgi:serine/threonine protein kinase
MEKYCPKCFKKYPSDVERCPVDESNLVSTRDRDLTGQTLDNRYKVLGVVGRGGMGVVYRAEQEIIKREVALKVLIRDVVRDETSVKRFLNEARIIASLESNHTITLYDFGVTSDGLLYYTMELLDGKPLSHIIRDEGPLDFARASELVLQTCQSLEEAHKKGVLHRDIKPENLFVLNREEGERVKVLDFGIAKLIGDASIEAITKTGMVCGTPQYLSPEQVVGNPAVPASDLYSLGIVLYECLAGEPPFLGQTPMKLLMKHLNEKPVPVGIKNADVDVPESLNRFLETALEKKPEARFQNVPEFRSALIQAMEQHELSPRTARLKPIVTTSDGLRSITSAFDQERLEAISSADTQKEVDSLKATRADTSRDAVAGASQEQTLAPKTELSIRSDARSSGRLPLYTGLGLLLVAGIVLAILQPWKEAEKQVAAPQTESASPAKPVGKATMDSEGRIQLETRIRAETEAKYQAEAEAKAEKEARSKAEAEVKAKAEAEAQAKAEATAKAEAEAKAEAKAKAEAEAQAKTEATAKAEAEAKAEAKAKAEAEAKAKAEAQAKAEARVRKEKELKRKERERKKKEDELDEEPGFQKIPVSD